MENVVSTVKSVEVSGELKGAFRLLEAMFVMQLIRVEN